MGLICSEHGQGIVEYILVLFISILIVLGSVFQFNDAFKVWANNYFGDYLSCLLETGELPAIGGTGGGPTSCNTLFKEFSLADGRPYKEDGTSGSTGSQGGGNSSGSDSSQNGSGKENSNHEEQGDNTHYVSAKGANAGGAFGQSSSFGRHGGDDKNEGSSTDRGKKRYTGSLENSTPYSALSSRRGPTTARHRELEGRYNLSRDHKSNEGASRRSIKSNSSHDLKPRALIPVQQHPPQKSESPSDEPMTIGNFLRYLLIAALIIALLIVVGGQLLQISKEMD